jgi:outer membrane receptor for ferrienterochelin and colicin
MSYKQNIRILSVFAENFYSIAPKIDILLAARLDNHPFWGTNIAPRFGLFYSPNKQIFLRATYQSGFRGAVGLHYSGGYRRDGFLRADNYSLVERANIPNENNIPAILPEKMNSFELSLNWKPKEKFNLNVVGFYNQVENVIDVGVIYKDPNVFVVPNIGTDIAGDWNGYWFFKNTLGTFTQLGGEFLAKYTENNFGLQASYAFTSVNTATNEQKELAKNGNSMYLAEENEKYYYKAFPLSMIKANIYYKPINSILLSLTALQHSAWYSPAGTKAPSNVNFNAFISYTHQNKYEISVSIKNLFNQNILYPMTSNAGGLNVSPGTPAWESRSFWFTGRIKI